MSEKRKKDREEPLVEHLLAALHALDSQVAREMQRSPQEREQLGVQKWEPYAKRIEKLCAVVLNSVGDRQCDLDSLLIMAQAMSKSLGLLVEELGTEGLGALRSAYCKAAFEAIERDARNALMLLREGGSGALM